jgi:NAD(P)-dependent dehydrogenase (short-subunit alcohol dehydrogenase family)
VSDTDRELRGKVVLVTGATDGLGRGLATALASAGADVIVHGRSDERIAATVDEIAAAGGGERPRSYRADFASLAQVRSLAEQVSHTEGQLDVLVNNAGIGTTVPGGDERMESDDGHELRFAVNYLAGYLLTRELLPLLERSAPARIVNVASGAQMAIDFEDVMLERDYSGMRAYSQSKLAQVMHCFDLAERLGDRGVTVNCLHPATYMPTKMVTASPASSIEEGVRATMRLIADPALAGVSGRYFNGLREARADPQAYEPAARARLRELSERLTAGE